MKLDMGAAWTSAVSMLSANRNVVTIIGGVFFFIPLFTLFLFLFESVDFTAAGQSPDPAFLADQISQFLLQRWWIVVIVMIGQMSGAIVLLLVLADQARPTVRDAIASIPRLILPLFGSQILAALLIEAVTLPLTLLPPNLEQALKLVTLPVVIYLTVKFALTSPVVAIECERNPVKVLRRSWSLTKGNSLRLLGFFAMLIFVQVILFLVINMFLGLLLAMFSGRIELIGTAAFFAVSLAAAYGVGYSVIAAVHRQLAGPSTNTAYEALE